MVINGEKTRELHKTMKPKRICIMKFSPAPLLINYILRFHGLILEVDPLHSIADCCQNLIWNSIQCIAEDCYRQIVPKYLYGITFLAINTRNIYHSYIHADISNVLSLLAVDKAIAMAVAQVSVESVGLSYWYCSYYTVLINLAFAAITDCISLRHIAHLQDSGL